MYILGLLRYYGINSLLVLLLFLNSIFVMFMRQREMLAICWNLKIIKLKKKYSQNSILSAYFMVLVIQFHFQQKRLKCLSICINTNINLIEDIFA